MHPDEATEMVDQYCAAWGEPDPIKRMTLLNAVWANDGAYTDPTVAAGSLRELLVHLEGVQARRPGSKVFRTSAVDLHHSIGAFLWEAIGADGTIFRQGIDFVAFTSDGPAIKKMTGFFGRYRLGS